MWITGAMAFEFDKCMKISVTQALEVIPSSARYYILNLIAFCISTFGSLFCDQAMLSACLVELSTGSKGLLSSILVF